MSEKKKKTVPAETGKGGEGGGEKTPEVAIGGKKGEQTSLMAENDDVDGAKNMSRFYAAALAISWVSILFSLASGIAAIVLSFKHDSESLYAYGLDALLDSLSSVAVVWRFSDSTDHVKARYREYKACLVIAILFFVSAVSLIARSVVALQAHTREDKVVTLFIEFSLICGLSSLAIGLTKIYIGIKVASQALYTDSIITLVGAATCFMALAGLELYMMDRKLWYLDSVFGILCGVFLIIFGARLLVNTLRDKPKG